MRTPVIELAQELKKLAGAGAYERGLDYYETGRVLEFTVNGQRITASVSGSQDYTVNLRRTPRGFEGACDCPASEGFDFCKHCVAVALAVEARQSNLQESAPDNAELRIAAYVSGLPNAELQELLLAALKHSPELESSLSMRADVASGRIDAKYLRKMITAAMPLRDVWDYRQVNSYFARAETCISNVVAISSMLSPEVLLKSALHAIKRLEKILERVDDSGGRRYGLQDDLHELHRAALQRQGWSPKKLASHLLTLRLDDPWDTFDRLPQSYAEVLGEAGITAFYAEAKARLDKLPALPFGAEFDEKLPYLHLSHLLQERAEADGDLTAQIELALQTCTSALDCYRLAKLYLKAGDTTAASEWLSKGDAAADERGRDHRLRVAVHEARGEWPLAVAAQRNLFEQSPSIGDYRSLQELAAKAGQAVAEKKQAIRLLQAGLHSTPWHENRCALTLARIFHDDGKTTEAAVLVREHIHEEHQLLEAAQWFAYEPRTAAEFCAAAIEACVMGKTNASYRRAAEMLVEHRGLFEKARSGYFNDLVGELRTRHKAKRNFIALLNKQERS